MQLQKLDLLYQQPRIPPNTLSRSLLAFQCELRKIKLISRIVSDSDVPSGSISWTYSSNLPNNFEFANDVSAADTGKVYLAGATDGKVNGRNNGGLDAFLLRLDSTGKKVWAR